MKTTEELNAMKNEFEAVTSKLSELSEEEMQQVSAGINMEQVIQSGKWFFDRLPEADKQKLLRPERKRNNDK